MIKPHCVSERTGWKIKLHKRFLLDFGFCLFALVSFVWFWGILFGWLVCLLACVLLLLFVGFFAWLFFCWLVGLGVLMGGFVCGSVWFFCLLFQSILLAN